MQSTGKVNFPAAQGQSVIQRLQKTLVRIEEIKIKALNSVRSADHLVAGRALLALGLCQQATEQVRAACQNMGFSMNSLLVIDESAIGASADEQRRQLKRARIEVVKALTSSFQVSREAVFISIHAFAEDSATMAAMLVSRADHHLKVSVR